MNVARKIGLFLRHAASGRSESTDRNLSIKASTAFGRQAAFDIWRV